MTGALIVAIAALCVIAYLCWRLSRAHLAASRHCTCIAAMLNDPDQAEAIARRSRDSMKREGLWRS